MYCDAFGSIDTVILLCPTPPVLDYSEGKYQNPGGKVRFVPCNSMSLYQNNYGTPEHASKQMWAQYTVYGAEMNGQSILLDIGDTCNIAGKTFTTKSKFIQSKTSEYGCDSLFVINIDQYNSGETWAYKSFIRPNDSIILTYTPRVNELDYIESITGYSSWNSENIKFRIKNESVDTLLDGWVHAGTDMGVKYYCEIDKLPIGAYKYGMEIVVEDKVYKAYNKNDMPEFVINKDNVVESLDGLWATNITTTSAVLHWNPFEYNMDFVDQKHNVYFFITTYSPGEYGITEEEISYWTTYDRQGMRCKMSKLKPNTTYYFGVAYSGKFKGTYVHYMTTNLSKFTTLEYDNGDDYEYVTETEMEEYGHWAGSITSTSAMLHWMFYGDKEDFDLFYGDIDYNNWKFVLKGGGIDTILNSGGVNMNGMVTKFSHIDNLKPNTLYRYGIMVKEGDVWQPMYDTAYMPEFRTFKSAGIDDIHVVNTLNIYPNPAKENLTIELQEGNTNNATIEVFNSQGRLVFETKNVDVRHYVLDTKQFSNGIYYIRIGGVTKKLVVQ